ncbi:hypothetical protein GOP47_0016053 [Adiantum capillus-veneris]|uniref:Glutaredoxin domain-containing protein n=1 Tax=Adiantum capillus-veneris TaxID=13818 RepID=A0A9D4UL50_ADICA|nr:hypothetical protein GOP47_0016053 [Adiantum capillus-veneris]
MGATTSKEMETREGWKASLSRSVSTPNNRYQMNDESPTSVSWKLKLFSIPQSYRRGKSFKSGGIMSRLKPLREEEEEVDFSDSPEAFEMDHHANGHNQARQSGSFLNRSMTFQPSSETESQRRLVAPCKSFRERRGECETAGFDQSIGLRLLLNSSSLPSSQSLVSPSRGACLEKSLSTKESLSARRGNDFARRSFPRVSMDDASPLELQWAAASSTLMEPEIPLFDPSLLATFEKAVEDVALSSPRTPLVNKTESPFLSPGICLDTDKSNQNSRSLSRLKSLRSRAAAAHRPVGNVPQLTTFSFLNRKPSFSKVLSLKNDKRNWNSETYLDKFAKMCPPGCEGKVVLYFTSLRGVRKTYENCFMVRLILQGFRVHVDERDVWMHSKFRQELTDVMGVALSVPRLFILGRYIGGADEVELLNEEGILSKLLEGLPTECRQVCEICADVRFIPCTACSGSCKIISLSGTTERCSKCNENGLIMCPLCI